MLPTSHLCRTFLICLVDSCDLLVVPRGHDFDEDALVCASPLEEWHGGVLWVSALDGDMAALPPAGRGCSNPRAATCQKSTSSKWPQGLVGTSMEASQ